VPRVYLDQVALIRMGLPEASAEAQRVRDLFQNRNLSLVLSTAHWLDTAGGDSDDKSRRQSRFIDQLRPIWLRERIDLHRLEIHSFLNGVPFNRLRELAVFSTVTELVASIGGMLGGGAAIISSEEVVMGIRQNQAAGNLFARSYAINEQANTHNRNMFKAGKLTPQVERQARILGLQTFGGVAPGSQEDLRLQQAPSEAFRSLVCEWEATKETWRQGGTMTPNRVRDLFHLSIAMPYADIIVTSDQQLRETIGAVKTRVNFPVTQVVKNLRKLLAVAALRWKVAE
jgi:hypothetical protein